MRNRNNVKDIGINMSTSCYSLVSRGRGTIHSPKAFGIIYHLVAVVLPRGRQIELRRLCQSDVREQMCYVRNATKTAARYIQYFCKKDLSGIG